MLVSRELQIVYTYVLYISTNYPGLFFHKDILFTIRKVNLGQVMEHTKPELI